MKEKHEIQLTFYERLNHVLLKLINKDSEDSKPIAHEMFVNVELFLRIYLLLRSIMMPTVTTAKIQVSQLAP